MSRHFVLRVAAIGIALVSLWSPASAAQYPEELSLVADPAPARPVGGNFTDMRQRRPASLLTVASVSHDNDNFYVNFKCEQDPKTITATQTADGVGFGLDDFVGVGIDTSNNGSTVYYFESTPRGTRYQQASDNARYQPDWDATAAATKKGWESRLTIPLRVLQLRGGKNQTWRINFVRSVATSGAHYTWAWNDLMAYAPTPSWPGFDGVRFWPTLRIELARTPGKAQRPAATLYGLVGMGSDRNIVQQANGTFAEEPSRPMGIDVSYPLSPTISFVGTFHPDFSNLDIDQLTIAPQEFRQQYVEYRPFFAQGAPFVDPNISPSGGVFTPNNQIFYSPDIGPFDSGEKVEGTYGNQSFGLMHFHGFNVTNGAPFDDSAFGLGHNLPDNTFKYWADGVLANHGAEGQDNTLEMGAQSFNPSTGLAAGFNYANETGSFLTGIGHASSLNTYAGVTRPNYQVQVRYQDVTPQYDPIDGYTVVSDVRGFAAGTYLIGSSPSLSSFHLQVAGDRFEDQTGAVHQADAGVMADFTLHDQLMVMIGPQNGVLRSYATDATPASFCASLPSSSRTTFSGYPSYSCPIDQRFNEFFVGLYYRQGTPQTASLTASEGPFGDYFLHQYSGTAAGQISGGASISLQYGATVAQGITTPGFWLQQLRRLSLTKTFGSRTTVSIELRSISGSVPGITPPPGFNLAANLHLHLRHGQDVFIGYGSPSAQTTLNRLLAKYAWTLQ